MLDTDAMLLWKERLENCPIMSLQTGSQLGVAMRPIIDPRNLTLVAFYVDGPLIEVKPSVLHAADIREFGSLGMIVNDSDDIMPLSDDLVRLNETIHYGFEFIGMSVIDTHKHKLGKVSDYVVDSTDFTIMKFNVKASFLRGARVGGDLLIGRQQIREITDHEIVVAAPTVAESQKQVPVRSLANFENPFRKPQAEGNHANSDNHSSSAG